MTVKDLIEQLKTYLQEAEVVYRACSEYNILDGDEITFYGDGNVKDYRTETVYIKRNGIVMKYDPKQWDKEKDGDPKFIPIVAFPGN